MVSNKRSMEKKRKKLTNGPDDVSHIVWAVSHHCCPSSPACGVVGSREPVNI